MLLSLPRAGPPLSFPVLLKPVVDALCPLTRPRFIFPPVFRGYNFPDAGVHILHCKHHLLASKRVLCCVLAKRHRFSLWDPVKFKVSQRFTEAVKAKSISKTTIIRRPLPHHFRSNLPNDDNLSALFYTLTTWEHWIPRLTLMNKYALLTQLI